MTEPEIVEGLRSGAPDAFRALYDAIGSDLHTYLLRVMGRREMAEELTQECFLTVIRKIGFFRSGEGSSIRSWVFRIGTHLAIDILRKEKRATSLLQEPADVISGPSPRTPLESLETFENSKRVQEAMSGLSAAQRMVFLLHEQEGMSCLEISRICGCSENAVKQGLFRARKALKEMLCKTASE